MVYCLTFLIILLGLFCIRSKSFSKVQILLIILLFGFSFGNADYNVHYIKYTQINNMLNQTEILYIGIMRFFNNLGLSYQNFLFITACFVAFCYITFIKNNTKYASMVLSLYLIFPFCMDVTMVRYTISFSIVLFAINMLLSDKKFSLVKYLSIIFIASMIHISAIFYLIFLIPKYIKKENYIKFVLKIDIIFFAFYKIILKILNNIKKISFMNIGEKVNIITNFAQNSYNLNDFFKYSLKVIFSFLLFSLIYYFIMKWYKEKNGEENNNNINKIIKIYKINVILLMIIPFMLLSLDLVRMQMAISIVNYIAVANFLEIYLNKKQRIVNNGKINKYCFVTLILIILYAILNLYLWVLKTPNYKTVFIPLFENNMLIQ